jgi:pyruvate dehydrogenase E1 component
MQDEDGEALYLRLSTKPVDQAPFAAFVERVGEERARADVVNGVFRLREPGAAADRVTIAACGAIVPEVLCAADMLGEQEGVEALVLCLSSADRIYRDWRGARIQPLEDGGALRPSTLDLLLSAEERRLPIVTVIDGASHALAWLGSALGTRCVPLGVDRFGQTGSQPELYSAYGISADAITTAALVALESS